MAPTDFAQQGMHCAACRGAQQPRHVVKAQFKLWKRVQSRRPPALLPRHHRRPNLPEQHPALRGSKEMQQVWRAALRSAGLWRTASDMQSGPNLIPAARTAHPLPMPLVFLLQLLSAVWGKEVTAAESRQALQRAEHGHAEAAAEDMAALRAQWGA